MEHDSHKNFLFDNWVRFRSHENQEYEALSLCDLAINKHNPFTAKQFSKEHDDEDFDFGSENLPKNNKMCSADELFHRGKLLPVNSPSGFMTRSKSYSRSEPVSVTSSRSSSTRSHNAGTSGSSSSSTSGSEFTGYKHNTRNQFHSYPSPKPQIRTRSFRQSNTKSSSKWSLLKLGPVKPQEIGLADLRNRSQRSHARSSNMKDQQHQKKSQSQMLMFGGCNCKYSANVVESTVSLMVKPTTYMKEEETRLLWISKENDDAVRRRLKQLHFHSTN